MRDCLRITQRPYEIPIARYLDIYCMIQAAESLVVGSMHVPFDDEPATEMALYALNLYQQSADSTSDVINKVDNNDALG